jgi:hypothetical protein
MTEFDRLRRQMIEIMAKLSDYDYDINSYAAYINDNISRAQAHAENNRDYASKALLCVIDVDMGELRYQVWTKLKKSV